jgi:hypothetical protein
MASTAPPKNPPPPPKKMLTIAVGKMMNAARTLNFRNIIRTAPKRIKLRMIPIMKLKAASATTHGSKPLHHKTKPGDNNAMAFAMIRPAAIATSAAGNHHHLTSNGAFGNGPYHPGPKAPTGGATGTGLGPKAPTGAATGADVVGATGIPAGTLW